MCIRAPRGDGLWCVSYSGSALAPVYSKQNLTVVFCQVKSRFTLLGGKKAICRGSGPDWRAGAGARVWSPLPPGLSKESGER